MRRALFEIKPPRSPELRRAEAALIARIGSGINAGALMRGLRKAVTNALDGAWQTKGLDWRQVRAEDAIEMALEFTEEEDLPRRTKEALERYVLFFGREQIQRALKEEKAFRASGNSGKTTAQAADVHARRLERRGRYWRRLRAPRGSANKGDEAYLLGLDESDPDIEEVPDRLSLRDLENLL